MENTSPEIIVDTPMASVIPEEVERTENTEMMEETASDAAPADIGLSDSTRHIYKGQNSRFLAWLMEQVPNMITEHLAYFVLLTQVFCTHQRHGTFTSNQVVSGKSRHFETPSPLSADESNRVYSILKVTAREGRCDAKATGMHRQKGSIIPSLF